MTTSTFVDLHVTSSLVDTVKAFNIDALWGQVKTALEQITGVEVEYQHIICETFDSNVKEVQKEDDNVSLREWGVLREAKVQVRSTNAQSIVNELQNGEVERFVLDDDKYNARAKSVRQWKKELGVKDDKNNEEDSLDLGSRVTMVGKGLGTVRFKGPIKELQNRLFVGVEWDSAEGKNDGSIESHHYFHCGPSHGSFVPPMRLKPVLAAQSESAIDEI